MATNDRTEHGFELTAINDNQGEETVKPITPEDVRIALRSLVQLLARRAAHEWLSNVANDNTSTNSKPPRKAPPPKDTCLDSQE
jgi:hypothetical protein